MFEGQQDTERVLEASDGAIYAGTEQYGDKGAFYRSADGGQNWEEIPHEIETSTLGLALLETPDGNILVSTGKGVFRLVCFSGECEEGSTEDCTKENGCTGKKTCAGGIWGNCMQVDSNCGVLPPECAIDTDCNKNEMCESGKLLCCITNA